MHSSVETFQASNRLLPTVAHKGQCNKKWFAANKKDRMQTKNQNLSRYKQKKIGCKQKRSDANKKDRMQTKKPKPVTMQTKKIGCEQKTKTCNL